MSACKRIAYLLLKISPNNFKVLAPHVATMSRSRRACEVQDPVCEGVGSKGQMLVGALKLFLPAGVSGI
jgi:hypothetical protein